MKTRGFKSGLLWPAYKLIAKIGLTDILKKDYGNTAVTLLLSTGNWGETAFRGLETHHSAVILNLFVIVHIVHVEPFL